MKIKNDLAIDKFVFDHYLVIERYTITTPWYENVWRVLVEVPKRFFISLF